MPLKIRCPKCQKSLTVPDQLAGRTGTCPGCKTSISIPAVNATLRVEPTVVAATQSVAQPAADVPASSATISRLMSLSGRSWKFWGVAAAVVVGGGYMLSLFGHMTRVAWQSTFPAFADSSVTETALSRMGYDRSHCLACFSTRSATARSLYSDDHGFGLCQECGQGHEAMMRIAKNSGRGSLADQQASQIYFQTMQQHLEADPSEKRRAIFMSLMAFDSPEWNSLYGPVKPPAVQGIAGPRLLTKDDYRCHKLWNDFQIQLKGLGFDGSSDRIPGLQADQTIRFAEAPGDLVIFRDKAVVGLLYGIPQSGTTQALLLATVGKNVGIDEVTKIIELQSSALKTEGQKFQADVGNLRCTVQRTGFTISVLIAFLDEIAEYRKTGVIHRPFDIRTMPDF